jgi:hypothetical protein
MTVVGMVEVMMVGVVAVDSVVVEVIGVITGLTVVGRL